MSVKLPAIQFYFGDWKKDSALAMCSLPTRGFWFEILGAMHELGRSGQITGTAQQLARVCRCTAAEAEDAINELSETKAADVTRRNGIYTLINRRMKSEFEDRKANAEYVRNHRKNKNVRNGKTNVRGDETPANREDADENESCKTNVRTPSSSSTSTSNTKHSSSERKTRPPATRISADFAVTPEMRHWATEMRIPPELDLVTETELFKNKYLSQSGDSALSLDWFASWKNWILRGKAFLERDKKNGTDKKHHSGAKRTNREILDESADFYANYTN